MATYTTDAVALLVYLVDSLPERADHVFGAAEAGESVLQAPSTALGEVFYAVSRDKDVRGVSLEGTPEDARAALLDSGPVQLASAENGEMADFVHLIDDFGIHDAFVVASHRANETDAVITADGEIRDADVPTVWE